MAQQSPRREVGCISPTDPSCRAATPGCNSEHHYPFLPSIQQHRRSTPISFDHAHPPPGLFQPHDPADLAVMSTSYAHKMARRKRSLRGLACNPKHINRVASLVEGIMLEEEEQQQQQQPAGHLQDKFPSSDSISTLASQPSSTSLSLSLGLSGEDSTVTSPASLSTTMSSPDDGEDAAASSSSCYFSLSHTVHKTAASDATVRPDGSPFSRPKSVSSSCCRVGKELRHTNSHEMVMRPIRMRTRARKESMTVAGR